MNQEDFDETITELMNAASDVREAKGKDYTLGSDDRLHNFKVVAQLMNVSPKLVWGVYFSKHVCAILSWAADRAKESEPIESRFIDLHNYILLGNALFHETSIDNAGKEDFKARQMQQA